MIGWILHFLCARCIEWLFKPLSIPQELDESKRVDCRVRGVAKTEHLPACHTIGPLHKREGGREREGRGREGSRESIST